MTSFEIIILSFVWYFTGIIGCCVCFVYDYLEQIDQPLTGDSFIGIIWVSLGGPLILASVFIYWISIKSVKLAK